MSKCKIAIIEVLASGKWMTSNQIAAAVGFKATAVRSSLANMARTGLALKKDDPNSDQLVLWKKSDIQSGFGVSTNIALFDRCLREARL